MARPIGYKQRVHMPPDLAVPIRMQRSSPLAIPVAVYWTVSGMLMYGISSGAVPLSDWLEGDPHAGQASFETYEPVETVTPVHEAPLAPPPIADEPAPLATTLEPAPLASPDPLDPSPPAAALLAPPTPEPARSPAPAPAPPLPPPVKRAPERPEPPRSVAVNRKAPVLSDRPLREERSPPPPIVHDPNDPIGVFADVPSERTAAVARKAPDLQDVRVRPVAPSDPLPPPPARSLGSCEAALESYQEEMDLSARRGRRQPDLTREQYASILENGRYLAPCGVPDRMTVDICAAVQNGRAVGVTVSTSPSSDRVRRCVARAVSRLSFPHNPRLDVTRTRFGAVR